MSRKKSALVKVSGDVADKEELYGKLALISREYILYVICGAGSAITVNLRENNIPFRFMGGERVIGSQRGKDIAYMVLAAKSSFLECQLRQRGIEALVCAPVIRFGDKICFVNGDTFVRMVRRNFSKVFVFALKGRDKSSLAKDIKKIEIIYL